ncbi:MAG: asparaginase, partial [Acidimicrobiales bacterium]
AAPGPLRFRRYRDLSVVHLVVTPLQPSSLLPAALEQNPDGVLLELYGVGTGPVDQVGLLEGVIAAREAGIPVVAVSSSRQAVVDLSRYEVGQMFAELGVISGRDMTAEAAATKLAHLLSLNLDYVQLCRAIGTDQRGELTRRSP